MNGFKVEPGERRACVISTCPARRASKVVCGRNARPHLAARIVDRKNGDRNVRPERLRAFARKILQVLLQGTVDGEPMHALIALERHNLIGSMRRQHGQLLAFSRHRLRFGARDLVVRYCSPSPRRDRARGRGLRVQPSENGRAGAVPATAARPPAMRLRPKIICAVPCRNTPAQPREHLPDFRRKARASDKAPGFRLCQARVQVRVRARSAAVWRPGCDARVAPEGAPPAS